MASHDDISGNFNTRPQKEALSPDDFDIVIDKKTSQVWVLHETPLINQNSVSGAEYNSRDHRLKFVTKDGAIQFLGAPVQAPLRPHLEKAVEITAILMDGKGNMKTMFVVPLRHLYAGKKDS